MKNIAPQLIKCPPWDNQDDSNLRANWQSLTSETIFQNPWLELQSHEVIAPTGHHCHYGLVRFKNRAIGILPIFDDATVIMVGQQRFATNSYSWEIPEGGVPFDEDPLTGAKRELLEETGLRCDHWQEILSLDISNSVTDEVAVCFLATGLQQDSPKPDEPKPDETESFEYARVPFNLLLKSVIRGEIRDAITVASVLKAYHMANTGEISHELADLMLNDRA